MRKSGIALAACATLGALPQSTAAQGVDWLKGGPISNALVKAIEERDEAGFNAVWSGSIYELTGRYRGTVTKIDKSRIFDLVEGCALSYKADDTPDGRAGITWSCKDRPSSAGPCFFEEVNLGLRVLQFADKNEALFVAIGSGYKDECGPIKPAVPNFNSSSKE